MQEDRRNAAKVDEDGGGGDGEIERMTLMNDEIKRLIDLELKSIKAISWNRQR